MEEFENEEPTATPGEGEPGQDGDEEPPTGGEEAGHEEGEGEGEPTGEGEPGKEGTPKGVQKRIDRAVAAQRAAEREAAYWRGKAEGKTTPDRDEDTGKREAPGDGRPKPEQFETHDEYQEALIDWKVERRLKAKEETDGKKAEEGHRAERMKSFNEQVSKAKEKYEDFDLVVSNPEIPITEQVMGLILESDHGAEVAYHLGNNPDVAHRIATLSPTAAAREFGRLEARFAEPAETKEKTRTQTKPNKVPGAPPPIKPLSGKKASTEPDLETMGMDDYARHRGY